MANFRMTYVYSQPNKGWTEVYYLSAANIAAASAPQPVLWAALINFRAGLTVLNKVRVADVAGNRSALVVPINVSSGLSTGNIELGGDAAVVNLVNTTFGVTRRLWLRGLRQIDMARNATTGVDTISAFLSAGIGNLISNLVAGGYVVRSLAQIGIAPNVFHNITNIQATGGAGEALLTYLGAPDPVVGDQIIVSQVSPKLVPAFNGKYRILKAGVGNCTIGYNSPVTINLTIPKGRWRPANYNYGPVDGLRSAFDHLATRTTGKNSLGGRGRRRALFTHLG